MYYLIYKTYLDLMLNADRRLQMCTQINLFMLLKHLTTVVAFSLYVIHSKNNVILH